MLKLVLLSVFLSVGLAANINDIYGTFTSVVVFTEFINPPQSPNCVKYSFAEDPSKVQCTCSDGIKTTLVEIKVLEHLEASKPTTNPVTISGPILAVDNLEDLVPSTNVTCDCAGKEFDTRGAIKIINEDYIVGYIANGRGSSVVNDKYLLARNLPTAASLAGAADLKDKSHTVVCTQEIYETLRPKN